MTATQPLVSVIIPAYNAEKFIGDTLKSVLTQTYSALEIIVVNDGSADNTENAVKAFDDPRIKYIAQSNRGCSGAKNTGLLACSGAYIQYLDADDLLSPDKIGEQVAALEARPGSVAVCRTVGFSSDPADAGDEIDSAYLYSTDDTLGFVLNLYGANGIVGMIQPNAFLLPRSIADKIGEYDLSISPAPDEDGEYFCRAMLAASAICYTPTGLNYYRRPANQNSSLSRQVSPRHAGGALRSLQLIARHLRKREDSPRVRAVIAVHFANFIYLYSQYRDLVQQAKKEISELGIRRIPAVGGKNFKKLVQWVGFDTAMLFKKMFQQ